MFITGITYSNEATSIGFPVIGGSYDTHYSGGGDAFVSKLSNDLSNLEASTYLGGNLLDRSNAIIVDASNNIYLTGQTFSSSFPIVHTANQETYGGNGDVFVSKFNNALSDLTASTFIGGTEEDIGYALATDQQNYIYVTGATISADFPVMNYQGVVLINNIPFNNGYKGEYDAFIVKLAKQHLEKLEASSLLGGSERDEGRGIAVDPLGKVYIVGGTWSNNMACTTGARQQQNNGMEDAFLIIFDKQIQTVLSNTYLGGNGIDVANGIIVSDHGNIGIIGTTNSTNFYNNLATGDITPHGMEDVFFSAFTNPMTAQERVETTLLGGANADYGQAIAISEALGEAGDVYLAGDTWSNDYPTTIGVYQPIAPDMYQYVDDAFVSKLDNIFDTQAPIVGPTDPANNAVDVPLNKVISIVFNEKIRAGSQFGSITLQHGGVNTPITVNILGTSLNTLLITPLTNLLPNTNYILSIPVNAIQDYNGNIGNEFTLSFKTINALNVISTNPVNGAYYVVGNTPIKITFNKSIKTGPNYNLIVLKNSANVIMPITKTISDNVLTITPTGNLIPGTYTVTLPINSIYDLTNTGFTQPLSQQVSQYPSNSNQYKPCQ